LENKEWTKKIRKGRSQNMSKVAGTEIADRGWLSLKKFIPSSFPRHLGCHNQVKEHPELKKLVQQFMRRKLLGSCQPSVFLARLCKAAKQVS